MQFESAGPSVVRSIRQRDLLQAWIRLLADRDQRPVAWERLLLPFCEGGQAKVLMASLKPVSTEGRFESRGLMTNNEARRYLVYAIIDQGLVAGRTSRRGPNEEIV